MANPSHFSLLAAPMPNNSVPVGSTTINDGVAVEGDTIGQSMEPPPRYASALVTSF
jgi:hypothetical protein